MVVPLVIGAAALLGLGVFSSSLVASIAEPVALILAVAAGGGFMIQALREGLFSDFFSSEEGEFLGAGMIGAALFYLAFVVSQALIVSLSPLAGVLVVGLGVAVFVFGPGILVDLLKVSVEVFAD